MYVSRRFQVHRQRLKLSGTCQLPVYAEDVNILGGSIRIIKENAEALVIASKETGTEVNVNKMKYMVMSRYQNRERSHNMKIDNSSFEKVEQFWYLGTTLTNQNAIQEEIKSGSKPGNDCYHSMQNLSSSSLLREDINI